MNFETSSRTRHSMRFLVGGALGAWVASWTLGALAMPTPPTGEPTLNQQPEWKCADVRWADAPQMKDNRAVGKMLAECTLEGVTAANLGNLYDSWMGVLKVNHEVLSDPQPTSHDRVSGLKVDLVEQVRDDGNGPLKIHKNAEFSSDRRNRFVYSSESKDIEGSGNAAFLKKLNTKIEVTRDSSQETKKDRLTLTYSDQLAIERPWYAPDGIFLSEIEKRSLKNFEVARERLTAEILERIQPRPAFAALIH